MYYVEGVTRESPGGPRVSSISSLAQGKDLSNTSEITSINPIHQFVHSFEIPSYPIPSHPIPIPSDRSIWPVLLFPLSFTPSLSTLFFIEWFYFRSYSQTGRNLYTQYPSWPNNSCYQFPRSSLYSWFLVIRPLPGSLSKRAQRLSGPPYKYHWAVRTAISIATTGAVNSAQGIEFNQKINR